MERAAENQQNKLSALKIFVYFLVGAFFAAIIVAPVPGRVQAVAERALGPTHPFARYLKEDKETRSLGRLMLAYSFYYVRSWMPLDSESADQTKRLENLYSDPKKYQEYMDMWKCMDEYFERKGEGCPNPLNEPVR